MKTGIESSISAVRKALLERDINAAISLVNEDDAADQQKLVACINAIEDSNSLECAYLGNGAFDIRMF